MIDAKELRSGNFVGSTLYDYPMEVETISHEGINHDSDCLNERVDKECLYENLIGIELTPDILLKCGFEVIFGDVYKKGIYDLEPIFKDGKEYGFHINEVEIDTVVLYLHQLQNIYFALTGTELTFNQQ